MMSKSDIRTRFPFLAFVLLAGVTLLIWGIGSKDTGSGPKTVASTDILIEKSDDGKNGVTFSVAVLTNIDGNLTFKVKVDTHSGDLSEVDFKRDIVLEKDGRTYFANETVLAGGGHHLEATMSFAKVASPFLLVAKNIRRVERREFSF